MEVHVIDDSFDPKEFNSVSVHPLQSWEWGEARKKMGIEVLRLGEFKDAELLNVFQMTIHPIPHAPYTIGYLPRTVLPSSRVIKKIQSESKKKGCVFVKTEPYVYKDLESPKIREFKSLTNKSPHPLFPKWTQMLDIRPDEEELLKNMKSKTRYNIRLAEKKGVKIKEMTNDEGFRIFSELYFETTRRQSYHGHDEEYHRVIFNMLKKEISHIFIAFFENTPLAAYHLFKFNDVLYYPYGGSSAMHRNLMASNLLMWEAIRFGKKAHMKTFDMWGSLPEDYDRAAPWSGFTRFKEGYGTHFVEFVGSYDIVNNPILYRVYNVADVIRKKFIL